MSDDYEVRKKLTENVLGDADWAVDQILELRAEVERLTAKANRFDGMESVQSLIEAHNRERALADQLAEALGEHPALRGFPEVVAALAAWEAARHE